MTHETPQVPRFFFLPCSECYMMLMVGNAASKLLYLKGHYFSDLPDLLAWPVRFSNCINH